MEDLLRWEVTDKRDEIKRRRRFESFPNDLGDIIQDMIDNNPSEADFFQTGADNT